MLSGNLSLVLNCLGWFLIILGISLIFLSVYDACSNHFSDYSLVRLSDKNEKEMIGYYGEDDMDDMGW